MVQAVDKDIKYGEASLRVRESIVSKIKTDLNKAATDSGLRFLKLIELVPNWETYLTEKQLQVAIRYIKCMSAYEVDHQLKLNYGTTQQRLFGNNKTSKGALGRLEEAYKKLEKTGYYERQERLKEQAAKAAPKPQQLSDKVLVKTKELIQLVVQMPDYEKYLTKSQAEKVYYFLRYRNYRGAANHLGITEISLRQALLGKTDSDGVLAKLKKVISDATVNSWDEI